MVLYIIGLGLYDEKDITLRGLEAINACEKVYLEGYTAVLNTDLKKLESLYNKNIVKLNREQIEQTPNESFLEEAKHKNIALLVIGDPMSATTHIDLLLRARQIGINVKIIHNASIITAVGKTGLQVYKFGKTTSIPFSTKSFKPVTCYEVLGQNKRAGLHTLFLLDLDPVNNKFMTVNEAIKYLLELENSQKAGFFTPQTYCVGVARIGGDNEILKSGKASELMDYDFGGPMHSLIVPGRLHYMEELALKLLE